jgi:dipeptidyl-peptidase 9
MFSFHTNDADKCKLYGLFYKPFNYVEGNKYPTLLYVYGGPCAQMVTNEYKTNRFSRFNILSLLNYCVVIVDSRGSANRGSKFERFLEKRMGTVEISDQVAGIEAAQTHFKCIDMKRIGIYGWSYGGYMALMGLAQRPDIFKVAISGAPVTSWTLYDTAYTERYMGLPKDNRQAYENGSVLNCVRMFPDEEDRLLIIHGLIDENVHFVNSRMLVDALIRENKPHQIQIYPNERHGIRSREASIHCDISFYSFLQKNL